MKSDRVRAVQREGEGGEGGEGGGEGGGGGRGGGRGGGGGGGGGGRGGGARTHQDFGAPLPQTAQIHWRRRNFTAGPWRSFMGSHRGTPPHHGGLEAWGSVARGLRGGE